KAELEKQGQERARVEADLRAQLDATNAGGTTAQARVAQLEQELNELRQVGDELNRKFTNEQQVTAESGQRVRELETDRGHRAAELDRSKAELEKQGQERARVESDLRRQLETATTAAKQGEEAHKQAQNRCGQLEEELAGLRQSREQLNNQL